MDNDDVVDILDTLGEGIERAINAEGEPRRHGFVLMMFPLPGYEGPCTIVSSLPRDLVMTLLRDQVRRFEESGGGSCSETPSSRPH